MMKKKTGLYFGTFNPIHIGHCVIAEFMLKTTDLQELWFVITPHSPFKKKSTLLADHQRLAMVRLALEDQYQMQPSTMEFDLPQPSYTATTLAHAAEQWSDRDFCLIMGADNLQSFKKWKNYEWILEHHEIYVYPRRGTDGGDLKDHPKITMTEAPIMEISSSQIRQSIKDQKPLTMMLPKKVWEYLDGGLFYR